MSIPKFNLSKLRKSVLRQQQVTKKDIANLLLLDRLQSQVKEKSGGGDDISYTFGFKPSGKRYTRGDKKDLKKNPLALFANSYIDSILKDTEVFMEADFSSEPEVSINYIDDKGFFSEEDFLMTLPENIEEKAELYSLIGHYFLENLIEPSFKYINVITGDYSDSYYAVDNINNRFVAIDIEQSAGYFNVETSKEGKVFTFKDKSLNTRVGFLKKLKEVFPLNALVDAIAFEILDSSEDIYYGLYIPRQSDVLIDNDEWVFDGKSEDAFYKTFEENTIKPKNIISLHRIVISHHEGSGYVYPEI